MKKRIFVFIVLISFALTACDISSASLTTSSSTDSTTAIATTSSSTNALTTTSGATSVTTTGVVTTTSTSTTSVITTQRVFTLQELATYNGDSGSLAYMAVNGVVYNVTHVSGWSNGWHQGLHLAGTDATVAFASSPHPNSYLDSLPVVGVLAN